MSGSVSLADISAKLTESLLCDFLKRTYGLDAKMTNYTIEGGSGKGDSYLSCVYRIRIQGILNQDEKQLDLPLIVKCLPKSAARRKTFRSVEFFRNEVAFYNQVVPRFLEFQKKRKPKNPFSGFPRCYYALSDGRDDVIVMEDLSFGNYKTAGRQEGLDFQHCTYILQLLGRFHGLSLAMKDQTPVAFKAAASSVKETYYKPEIKAWYIDQLNLFAGVALDAVQKELAEKKYAAKLSKFTDNRCYERMTELAGPVEPFACISHGDAWAPNFLIRYAEDNNTSKIDNVRVIDFQLARYGSPVLDISFFIYSCAAKEILFERFDDILQIYYKSLHEFVSDLGSSPDVLFPFESFQDEVKLYFLFGLGMSLESVPLSIVDGSDTPDVDSIQGEEAIPLTQIWSIKPIKSKDGRMRIAYNVKHAVDNGYI